MDGRSEQAAKFQSQKSGAQKMRGKKVMADQCGLFRGRNFSGVMCVFFCKTPGEKLVVAFEKYGTVRMDVPLSALKMFHETYF